MINSKELPNALEAERALLAALLHDNLLYEKISDFLLSKHFFDPLHEKIYEAIVFFIQKGQLANSITLWTYFAKDEMVIERGGKQYLNSLSSYLMLLSHTYDYGKIIFDNYIRRQIIRIGDEMIKNAYDQKVDESAIKNIENSEQSLFELASTDTQNRTMRTFANVIHSAIEHTKQAFSSERHVTGVATGFIDLDKYIGGLHPSDLIIIAGRPSMGKTALATNIAFQAAQMHKSEGTSVAFFSLEMSAEQLAMRILSHETKIPSDKIRRGAVKEQDMQNLIFKSQKISNLPLYIDDTPALTMAGLRTRARRLLRQHNIGLIVIDYLQLLTVGGKSENRIQELSFITRSLKALAKELNIPILALSQLSRAVEQRDDKRPQLSDLRESGTIEQDADVVMFIFREAYYEARRKPSEGSTKMQEWQDRMNKIHNVAEVIIAKQRHGPIRNIMLHFDETVTKFANIDLNAFK